MIAPLLGLAVTLSAGCATGDPPWIARGRDFMVASDSPAASRIGRDILLKGGNAADAAIAVSFALAVTRPYSTGPGGGSFTLVRNPEGDVTILDAREVAPAAATRDMYVRRAKPDAPRPSRYGLLAAGVPGWGRGNEELFKHTGGRLSWADLVEPAIRLADNGFPIDDHYLAQVAKVRKRYDQYPALRETCNYVYRTHVRQGDERAEGDRLVQPSLARLLRAVARNGVDVLYTGPIARDLVKTMRDRGGLITADDLAGYRVKHRAPVVGSFLGYDIVSMPPPSSGGVAIVETLNILDQLDYPDRARQDPRLGRHLAIEAMKQAFADRARFMGDTDFVDVPVDRLAGAAHAKALATRIDPLRAAPVDPNLPVPPDDGGTSHFCVVDGQGMCVLRTETINTPFGSLAAVDDWGLILNNEMDDFAAEPGKPNAYGLVQSERNAVAPGKRPLSSMAPTLVLRDGEPVLMLGASGGPRIISSVLHVMLRTLAHGDSLESAMRGVRAHHQWLPDRVFFDRKPPEGVVEDLAGRGHEVSDDRREGIVQAIMRVSGEWVGASDPRKGGQPAGR